MNQEALGQPQVEDRLSRINRLLQSGDYDVAFKESCGLIELAYKKIFQQTVMTLPYQDRDNLLQKEKEMGKGAKGVQEFSLGQLVGLFRESKFLDLWSKHTNRDLGILQTLDLGRITNLRNSSVHEGATCSRGEANIIYEYLLSLLAFLGFSNLDQSITRTFNETQNLALEAQQTSELSERLPKIRKSIGRNSIYSSSYRNEGERLSVQADNNRKQDLSVLSEWLPKIAGNSDKGLRILDIGCASGAVTHDRFSSLPGIRRVLGIDFNADKIAEANTAYSSERFSFHTMNIESEDFEQQLLSLLRSEDLDEVDVIFSALTLHHLANPLKTLTRLRKFLRRGGIIILRGSDDGSKIAYPDPQNLVKSIIFLTQEVAGVSDRENGRKLYTQLLSSGFRQVTMDYDMKDTSGKTPDDRAAQFMESFSYRIHYFLKRLEQEPDNSVYQEEYDWMKDALDELEIQFLQEQFYYHEISYIAIAHK